MKCPICKKPVAMDDPYMPFCSERCKLIDLGNWASEKYVISTPIRPSDEEQESPPDED
jgi:endogenous inhibitor of DNA gyrase (YacG/DUF329 family)